MNYKKWLESLSDEQRETWKQHKNKHNRERYAADAQKRADASLSGFHQYHRTRQEVIAYLGGRCVSPYCKWINLDGTPGCTDSRCLQIDHVNGDGAKRRKSGEEKNGSTLYRKVMKTTPGVEYQLLCANCNWIKRRENNEVPKSRFTENSWDNTNRRKTRKKDAFGRFVKSEVFTSRV